MINSLTIDEFEEWCLKRKVDRKSMKPNAKGIHDNQNGFTSEVNCHTSCKDPAHNPWPPHTNAQEATASQHCFAFIYIMETEPKY